jgi:hypothetical protein
MGVTVYPTLGKTGSLSNLSNERFSEMIVFEDGIEYWKDF